MKIAPTRSARAFAALVPTLMLVSPAFAQEIPAQTTPPPVPVVQAAPAPEAQPAPQIQPVPVQPAPEAAASPAPTTAAPVAPAVADDAPAADARSASPRRAATRTAHVTTTAPRAAAPVVTPVTTPVVTTPVAETAAPVAPTTAAAPVAASPRTTQSSVALWPWIVGAGIVLLGLIALLAGRRRRARDAFAYDEPAYQQPVLAEASPLVAPVVAREPEFLRPAPIAPRPIAVDPVAAPAPVPAEETHIVDAEQADVDALTAGESPVADRPWIEFGMRPVRAGTTSDEALVEIELTVGNAGSVAADDVRISTFLFAAEPANAAEFEKLLLEHGADATADPVSIAAGEGTRIDATLALPKHDLAAMFSPVVVADARYRLPDGGEGRTFASFAIGMTQEDGALGAMENNRPSMHEDVEARLYGTPEHV